MTALVISSRMIPIAELCVKIILQVDKMDSIRINAATEYGFYYAPVFSYYFSTGYFAWEKAYCSSRNRSR